MIRVLIYLVIVALLAFGAVWLADRPGDVAITWQGYRIETSVMVLMVAVAAVAVAAVMLWSIVRTIVRSPDLVALFLSNRRGVRGYLAISRGLIAVGAGDAPRAAQAAERGRADRAGRAAGAPAQRADRAARPATATRPPSTRSAPWRSATTPSCSACAACYVEAQRRKDRAAARRLCRGGGASRAGARLGRAGGAGIPLRRRRLERRARGARPQQPQRPDRQDRLPAPARRAADRARARGRDDGDRDRARARSRSRR